MSSLFEKITTVRFDLMARLCNNSQAFAMNKNETTDWQPNICLYHHNCNDGFGAAWLFHKYFGRSVNFIGVKNDFDFPNVFNQNVIILDLPVDSLNFDKIVEQAASVLIIDHHAIGLPPKFDPFIVCSLNSLNKVFCNSHKTIGIPFAHLIDQSASTCMLVRKFLGSRLKLSNETEKIINIINECDMNGTLTSKYRSVWRALSHIGYDFRKWDKLNLPDLENQGELISQVFDSEIARCVASANIEQIGRYRVLAANAPAFIASEVAGELAYKSEFGAAWYECHGKRKYSLRSTPESAIDVRRIAEMFGGGGHFNAAGFRISASNINLNSSEQC